MYSKETTLPLLIAQILNLVATCVFLFAFVRRYRQLRTCSTTYKYQNHFPKRAVVFCGAYILGSIALLIHNVNTCSYDLQSWYEYLLQGGGGQCIDAVVLLFQLAVVKYEIQKEAPYTKLHYVFFVYLLVMEIVRFIITLLDAVNGYNDIITLLIASLILLDVLAMLCYWKIKRQTMPEFIDPTDVEIEDLNYHTRIIQSRNQRSFLGKNYKKFPYIVPFVCFENGSFKIVLERVVYKDYQSRRSTSDSSRKRQESGQEVEQSLLTHGRRLTFQQELVSSQKFNFKQIRKIYAICGRYNIKKQFNFQENSPPSLVRQVQLLLSDIFTDQKKYDEQLLMCLGVPPEIVREYDNYFSKSELEDGVTDRVVGTGVPEDLNSSYFSVVGYKTLWCGDHYKYYFKVVAKNGQTTYPFKQSQDFQELYSNIKKGLRLGERNIELPELKRKIVGKRQKEESLDMLCHYQSFLRKVTNDCLVMYSEITRQLMRQFLEVDTLGMLEPVFQRQYLTGLRIEPRKFYFALKSQQSVTMYEFRLVKGKDVIKTISRDEQSLIQLHEEVQRWFKNCQMPCKIEFPAEKRKKELMLFKIGKYLQEVVNFKQIYKLYALTSFIDVENCYKSLKKFRKRVLMDEVLAIDVSFSTDQSQSYKTEKAKNQYSPPSYFSNRISDILNDLGNESLD